jgi:acetyltransferase-like isoleucine patch superfamily enzyme/acyl carrier protein
MTTTARVNTPASVAGERHRGSLRALIASTGSALALRHCDSVGRGARLSGWPVIQNLGSITIGDDLSLHSRPVVSHLVTGPGGVIEIGHGVSIGHGAGIAAHAAVRIAHGVRIGSFVLIMDTDFHEVGDRDAAPESRPITIGAGARIGSRVTILRGATIGAGAEVLPGSVVAGEVPAGTRVSGVPARPVGAKGDGARSAEAPSMSRIKEVITRTFGLPSPPADSDPPDAVAGWDSLGTLNLLLSLEEEFEVQLEPRDLLAVRCVGDLLTVVVVAVSRSSTSDTDSFVAPHMAQMCQEA